MSWNLKNNPLLRELSKPFPAFSFTVFVFLVDELSKFLAGKYLPVSCNMGIAFGFAVDGRGISAIALVVIFWLFLKSEKVNIKTGLLLVFSGGLANFADRLLGGCVRDFISISVFPSFNISDAIITLGVAVVFYAVFFEKEQRAAL